MKMRLTLLAIFAATSAQSEEICNDLWFARNGMFDSAGYCFGSLLGKSLYDNKGCTTSNPILSVSDRQKLSLIEQREAELGCKVDTSKTAFELTALHFRKLLRDQPVRSDYESSCIGWKGQAVEVSTGPSSGKPIGTIEAGDSVLYSHFEEDGWFYVTVWSPPGFQRLKVAGWLPDLDDVQVCEDYAG